MFIERFVAALGAKFVRELIREFVGKLNTLNAALLQKSAPRPALSRASDFAPIRQNVRADRIREAVSVVIGVADAGTAVSDRGYRSFARQARLADFAENVQNKLVRFLDARG